jgi:hypothetical protein
LRNRNQDSSEDDSDIVATDSPCPNVSQLKGFLLNEAAIELICRDLNNLINSTYKTMLQDLKEIYLTERRAHRPFNKKDTRLIHNILDELEDAEYSSVRLTFGYQPSPLERIQAAIEQCTNYEWDWWPLSPPLLGASTEYIHLSWICVSFPSC